MRSDQGIVWTNRGRVKRKTKGPSSQSDRRRLARALERRSGEGSMTPEVQLESVGEHMVLLLLLFVALWALCVNSFVRTPGTARAFESMLCAPPQLPWPWLLLCRPIWVDRASCAGSLTGLNRSRPLGFPAASPLILSFCSHPPVGRVQIPSDSHASIRFARCHRKHKSNNKTRACSLPAPRPPQPAPTASAAASPPPPPPQPAPWHPGAASCASPSSPRPCAPRSGPATAGARWLLQPSSVPSPRRG